METPRAHLLCLLGEPAWHGGALGRQLLAENLPSMLLVYLAAHGHEQHREVVAALFWPDASAEQAKHNLRANLHRVKQVLIDWGQEAALRSDRHTVHLSLPTDLAQLQAGLGQANGEPALHALSSPLFGQWQWRGFEAAGQWARDLADHLHVKAVEALDGAAARLAQAGDSTGAAQLLLQALTTQPHSEPLLRRLLALAADARCEAAALDAFDRFSAYQVREQGQAPAQHLVQWAARLRHPARLGAQQAAGALAQPMAHPKGAASASTAPRAAMQPPRLIGREAQCLRLSGTAQTLITLAGFPGVGKTRLLEEACPQAHWLRGREGWQGVALAPVLEFLHDHPHPVGGLGHLGDYRVDIARIWPAWADGQQLPPADSHSGQARLLEGLALLLEHGGTHLVVDDWQWMDDTTVALVALLAQRRRIPMRVAWRAHELPDGAQRLWQQWQLAGISSHEEVNAFTLAQVQGLLAAIEPGATPPAGLAPWLLARTGGNAFLLLQTLQAQYESGQLRPGLQGAEAFLQGRTMASTEAPTDRAAEVLRWRLMALSEPANRVLALVCVRGRADDLERLARASQLGAWEVAAALRECEARGLVVKARPAHDLLRQAVQVHAGQAQWQWLHAAVATHFEGELTHSQRARHWWAAARTEDALLATEAAARMACVAGLHAQALAMLDDASEQVLTAAEQGQVQALTAEALLEANRIDEAQTAAQQALASPAAPAYRAMAWRVRGAVARQHGQLEEAEHLLAQAAELAPDDDDILIDRAYLAVLRRDFMRWLPALRDALRRLRQQPPGADLLRMLSSLAAVYNECGDVHEGVPLLQEAWALASGMRARYAQVQVAISLVWALSALERNQEAVDIGREALALGDFDGTPVLRNNVAWCLRELGRLDEACQEYEALRLSPDASLALGATAKLVELRAQLGPPQQLAQHLQELPAAMDRTQVVVVRAAAVLAALNHGQEADWRTLLARWQPASIDPWLAGRLRAALQARGLRAEDYLLPLPAGDMASD